MKIQVVRAATLHPARPAKPTYFQAVPLYLKSDQAAFAYFRDHRDEIDAVTGTALVVALPDEIETGKLSVVAGLFGTGMKSTRYPGLLLSDLPCLWLEDAAGGHEVVRLPNDPDQVNALMRALTDAVSRERSARDAVRWTQDRLDGRALSISPVLRILLRELPVNKSTERLLATIFGVVFVAAILALAVVIPTPSPFQYTVFRIVLAVAAAGFVSMTPGFLEVTVSNWLRAGGALAVFVIVFFYAPAAIGTV